MTRAKKKEPTTVESVDFNEVKLEAAKHYKSALRALVNIMETCEDPNAVIRAANSILDRAAGKAPQALELSGPNGAPIQQAINQPPPLTREEWLAQYSGSSLPH